MKHSAIQAVLLFGLLTFTCLFGPSLAYLNADEIASLKVIRDHYPTLATSWTDSYLSGACSSIYSTSFSYGQCSSGHLATINFASVTLSSYVGELGNITGLTYLRTLSIGGNVNLPDLDVWIEQLSSLTTLTYSVGTTYGAPLFSGNFSANPLFTTMNWYDSYGNTFPNITYAPTMSSLTMRVSRATTIDPDYLVGLNLTYLSFSQTGNYISPYLTTLPSIGHLTYLQTLILDYMRVVTLPDEFTALTRLETFTCTSCSYLTHLPPSMSNCAALTTVSCINCRLNQVDSLPNFSATKLNLLNLQQNLITTVWPTGLCQLSSAPAYPGLTLWMQYNALADVPACFSSTVNLYSVNFYSPAFTTFPTVLASMPTIQSLTIYYAQSMTGNIPDLSGMTALLIMDLRYNALTGAFPALPPSLQTAYLGYNSLSGSLPDNIFTGATALRTLYLHNNQLSGPFPSSIGSVTTFFDIQAPNNRFTSLPESMGLNKQLRTIDFTNNTLSSIPSDAAFRNMTNLRTLRLGQNRNLNGELPTWWAQNDPTIIQQVDLSGCSYVGSVPPINSTTLQYLKLSDNALDGTIGNIIKGSAVDYFYVDQNQLTGSIPASIGTAVTGFVGLQEFDVSFNRLTGSIPSSFGNIMSSLEIFNFNNNGISGLLPNLALASNLDILRGYNTNIRLCDVNPGIPYYIDECSLHSVSGFGSCGCESWYTRCTTNTTCPPPDYVAPPETQAPSGAAPTPIASPSQTPILPPGTPPPTSGSNPSDNPSEPASDSRVIGASVMVTLLVITATLMML